MVVETFMFFDLETTGLISKIDSPKITELTLLSVSRRDIEKSNGETLPPVSKLSFLFNPQKIIPPEVVKITGLSNDFLVNQPLFKDKIKCINTFLDALQPVCLVAHNGNRFDFKIINNEFKDKNAELPKGLLCVDSLNAFKEILKDGVPVQSETTNDSVLSNSSNNTLNDSHWPELDITPEDWSELDKMIDTFSMLTSTPEVKKKKASMTSYKLSNIYKALLKKEPIGSHRAEADCMMLLECVIATKNQFLPWADKNYKLLSSIKS